MNQAQTQMQGNRTAGAALGSVAPKQTSASEVYDQLSALADRAQALADRTENALHSVSQTPSPANEACDKVSKWYPPLFDSYIGRANSINDALRRIESALDRLEV